MIEGLSSLTATAGVRGVVVFDDADTCLASVLNPPYEATFIIDAVKRLMSVFDVFASLREGALADITLFCDGGGVTARYTSPHTIVALTEPEVNPNMLHVAMNVVALNLQRISGSVAAAPSSAAFRPNPTKIGFNPMETAGSSRVLTTTGSGGSQEIPPDAVDRAKVLQVLDVYRQFVGPAAKVMLKQELEGLGVTSRSLRQGQFRDFLARLARRIPSVERQQQFFRAVATLG
jgi:hypothetical protein